jgi:hypothetical protein
MYGFESITGWSRLNAVVSKDYRETMDAARADMDCWMNIWFLSYFVLIQYLYLVYYAWEFRYALTVIPSLILAVWLSSWQARVAAEQWGEWVKGAFDAYLPELCKKLGYTRPTTFKEEREFWYLLSQAITYRDAGALDLIEKYREKPTVSSSSTSPPVPVGDSVTETTPISSSSNLPVLTPALDPTATSSSGTPSPGGPDNLLSGSRSDKRVEPGHDMP